MKPDSRHLLVTGMFSALLAVPEFAVATPGDAMDQALDISLKEKKGIVLYVNGQAISGRVTKLDNENVEMSSREFARIVVRRERIDAVAGN